MAERDILSRGAEALKSIGDPEARAAAVFTTISHWRDVEANWDAFDPIIPAAEFAYALDSTVLKIGNGVDTWSALPVMWDGRLDVSSLADAVAQARAAAADSGDSATDSRASAGNSQLAATSSAADALKSREWAIAPRDTIIDGEGKSARASALDAADTAANSLNLRPKPITEADLIGGAYTIKAEDFGRTLVLNLLAGRRLLLPGGLAAGADGWPWVGIINPGASVAIDKVAGVVQPQIKAPIVCKWGQNGTPSAVPQTLDFTIALPALADGKFIIHSGLMFSESDSASHSLGLSLINPGPPESAGPAMTSSYATPVNDGTARVHLYEHYVDGGANFAAWSGKLRAQVSAKLNCIVIIIVPVASCGAKLGTNQMTALANAGAVVTATSPALVTPNPITITSAWQRTKQGDPAVLTPGTVALTGNSGDALNNPDNLYRVLSYLMSFQLRTVVDAITQTATFKASQPALGMLSSTWSPAGSAAGDPIISGSPTILSGAQRTLVANSDGIHWYT